MATSTAFFIFCVYKVMMVAVIHRNIKCWAKLLEILVKWVSALSTLLTYSQPAKSKPNHQLRVWANVQQTLHYPALGQQSISVFELSVCVLLSFVLQRVVKYQWAGGISCPRGVVNPPMHTLVCRFVAALNLASTWESGLGALSAYDHNLELPTQAIQGAGYRRLLGPDGGQNAECVRTEAGSVGGSVIGMLDGNQFQKQPEDKIKFWVYC